MFRGAVEASIVNCVIHIWHRAGQATCSNAIVGMVFVVWFLFNARKSFHCILNFWDAEQIFEIIQALATTLIFRIFLQRKKNTEWGWKRKLWVSKGNRSQLNTAIYDRKNYKKINCIMNLIINYWIWLQHQVGGRSRGNEIGFAPKTLRGCMNFGSHPDSTETAKHPGIRCMYCLKKTVCT